MATLFLFQNELKYVFFFLKTFKSSGYHGISISNIKSCFSYLHETQEYLF